MNIEIIDSRYIQYITYACDVLRCTPKLLVEDALKLHEANLKVLSHSLLMSFKVRDLESTLNHCGDGD